MTGRHDYGPVAIDVRVLDALRDAGDGANGFVMEVIDLYLLDSAARMVELTDAAGRHDAPALGRAAHSLRGASSAVGAQTLAGICGEIEALARGTNADGAPALVAALDVEYQRVCEALRIERSIVD